MLRMNEVLICKPSRFGMHSYDIKRRTQAGLQRVSVIASNGRAALEIAHAVFDGKCDALRIDLEVA